MDAGQDIRARLMKFGESYRALSERTGLGAMTLHGVMTKDPNKTTFGTLKTIADKLGFEIVLRRKAKAK